MGWRPALFLDHGSLACNLVCRASTHSARALDSEPCGGGRFEDPLVIGDHQVAAQIQRRGNVQGIQGAQVLAAKHPGLSETFGLQVDQCHLAEGLGHGGVIESGDPLCCPVRFGDQKPAGHHLVTPARKALNRARKASDSASVTTSLRNADVSR